MVYYVSKEEFKMKFEYIKKKLIDLRSKIEIDNEIGHFDINKIVEDVYLPLLNDVYGWSLKNANLLKENFPAIDLIDDENKVLLVPKLQFGDAYWKNNNKTKLLQLQY